MFRKQQPVWVVNSNPADALNEPMIAARRRANHYPISESGSDKLTGGDSKR
jgi:hypothetical protein